MVESRDPFNSPAYQYLLEVSLELLENHKKKKNLESDAARGLHATAATRKGRSDMIGPPKIAQHYRPGQMSHRRGDVGE